MREIKFRAWDKINKEFSNHTNRDPFMDLSMGDIFYWQRRQNEDGVYEGDIILKDENKNRFVLQQYTGLKDANGKEIYEGDILKIKEYDDEDEEFVKICEVKFGNSIFDGGFYAYIGFFLEDKYGYTLEPNEITSLTKCDGSYNFEVIGNIFENPELLKL